MLDKKDEREMEQQILGLADLLIENTIAISMLTEDGQEEQLKQSFAIVEKMAGLLEQYLGGHAEHLETLLHQLAQQKLPDENVLESFGDFRSHLDTAIRKGLELYLGPALEDPACITHEDAEPAEEPVSNTDTEPQLTEEADNITADCDSPDPEPTPCLPTAEGVTVLGTENLTISNEDSTIDDSEDEDYWTLALKQIFPDANIAKGYSLKGVTFSYFLPERSIAIDTTPPADMGEAIWKEYYCRQQNILLLSIISSENIRPRQLVRSIRRSLAENAGHNFPNKNV